MLNKKCLIRLITWTNVLKGRYTEHCVCALRRKNKNFGLTDADLCVTGLALTCRPWTKSSAILGSWIRTTARAHLSSATTCYSTSAPWSPVCETAINWLKRHFTHKLCFILLMIVIYSKAFISVLLISTI